MDIDDDGLAFIEEFEGWKKKLPDGRFCAYQDVYNGKKDIPTIGPGLTEGVLMGMVWTHEECNAAFKKELAKHVAAINRMVTVDLSQHQCNALVSLSYNVGIGAVKKSTVLKKFNAGDTLGAAAAFALLNRAGGAVCKGLVRRRAAEAALFLKPDEEPHPMPQRVDLARSEPNTMATATQAGIGTTAVIGIAQTQIDQAKQVKSIATDVREFIPIQVVQHPGLFGASLIVFAAAVFAYFAHRGDA